MITILAGTNSYALHDALKQMVNPFLAEHGDMALEQLDCEEVGYERTTEAVQSLPFLASKKLVVLHSPSVQKKFLENYEVLFTDIPEITDVIIIESHVDKRTAYYKWLKKQQNFHEFHELDENSMAKWAVQFTKQQGSEISSNDARYLLQRVGLNQERLANELKKLSLTGSKVTKQIIDELTEPTPQSKIFDLIDAAFTGQTKRAFEIYHEQRLLKVEPQEIIGMLGWQLRQIALAKTAGSHDLVREGKVSPYSASKAQKIANHITYTDLKQRVQDLVTIDARSKREPLDLDEALKNYILHLA